MWEYQVFFRQGDGEYYLRASDMSIADAVLFVKAYFEEAYAEEDLRFEIRRRPPEPKEG